MSDSDDKNDEFTEEEKNILVQKGLLLTQLLESSKFVQFLNMNYDIMNDEETKSLFVVEVPDDVAMQRAAEIMKEQAADAPKVQPASLQDLKKLSKK